VFKRYAQASAGHEIGFNLLKRITTALLGISMKDMKEKDGDGEKGVRIFGCFCFCLFCSSFVCVIRLFSSSRWCASI
jgi:hypothetical protein